MTYKKEYNKFLTASILDHANNKIASTAFITAFAVYLGLSDLAIGIYAIFGTMFNVIQIFAATIFNKIGQSKTVVLTNYTIYRLASVSFAFIPFLSNNISIRTALFFTIATIYAITGQLGYTILVNWRMTLVKKEDATKFVATRNIFKNTLVVAFSLLMGVVLDKFTAEGYELYGFLVLFGVVFLIAFIDIALRINTYKPEIKEPQITFKETTSKPAKDKDFRKILVVAGIYRFALGMGMMYLNVYLLRYVEISYLYYSILNIIIFLSGALFSWFWAKRAEARNWKKVLIPMSLLYIVSFASLFIFNNEVLIYVLPLIYFLIGVANSAYEMFENVAIYEAAKEKYKTSYVAFERFIEGLVTMILPLLSYTIFKEDANAIKITFLIAAVAYIVLILYAQTRKTQKDKN